MAAVRVMIGTKSTTFFIKGNEWTYKELLKNYK